MKNLLLLLLSAITLTACTSINITNENPVEKTPNKTKVTEAIEKKTSKSDSELMLEVYKNHLIKGAPGSKVLAPGKSDIANFYKDENSSVNFKEQILVEAKQDKSIVKNNLEGEYEVSNALIIPLPENEIANPGDIVLTNWQEGEGIVYAVVLNGGTLKTPRIRYLNKSIPNKTELLKENSFLTMHGDYMKGAPMVVKDGNNFVSEILLCECNGTVLTLSWTGLLSARDKEKVKPVDLYYNYKPGDDIFLNLNGNYIPAMIKEIALNKASATVLFTEKDNSKEASFDTLLMTKSLD